MSAIATQRIFEKNPLVSHRWEQALTYQHHFCIGGFVSKNDGLEEIASNQLFNLG